VGGGFIWIDGGMDVWMGDDEREGYRTRDEEEEEEMRRGL